MDNLFTDDNPQTTLKGLGFKNAQIAESSIQRVEQYFDKRLKYQKLPGYPISLKPHILLNNKCEAINYYRNQKMTRILSLANRAKVVIKQTRDPAKISNLQEAYNKLIKWISANKQGGDIYLNKYNKYFNRYKSLGGEDTNNEFNDQEYQRLKKIAKDRGIYAPKKYFSGLNYEESLARLDRMERGRKSDHSDPKSYSEFPTDFKKWKENSD